MRVVLFVLASILAMAPAAAAESGNVMATVHQFIDGINSGNMKSAVAACASPASVIDDFPPHEWQGATACADWAKGFQAAVKDAGYTDNVVTLGKPTHIDITGDRAYVVVSANYRYKVHGKQAAEYGSIFTVALHKLPAGWRITGWAWAKH
ncbi:MAG: nuclear transport factor 2 family protein [Candidatus Eremiobacteraeota bacterium]|nr:nuclear transport factor 2 family protein [Candidatus Eremiobacteraeota bacterium]